MLRLALVFLVIALLAALFGFTDVAGTSLAAAQMLFYVFLVLAIVIFLADLIQGRRPRDIV